MPELLKTNGHGSDPRLTRVMAVLDQEGPEIKLKARFLGEVLVLYTRTPLVLDRFVAELRAACKQSPGDVITVKWIDEEGTTFFMNFVALLSCKGSR